MELDYDEFMEAVRAYVREDGEIGVMVDARNDTVEQLLPLTGEQIVLMMAPHDFAAIISGCTRVGVSAGADLVQLGDKRVLSCRKGSGMADLLGRIAATRGGADYLNQIHSYLSWGNISPDISGYMYGARPRKN